MSDTDFVSFTYNGMSYIVETSIDGVIMKNCLKTLFQWFSVNLIKHNP